MSPAERASGRGDVGGGGRARPRRPPRPRTRRAALLPTLAVAAAGVLGGCGDSSATDAPSSAGSSPVLDSAAGPPGTPLGDGFEVAEGTTLIGDPIPIGVAYVSMGQPVIDDGWTATAIVTGDDPIAILDAYMRQAEDAGLAEQPGTGCVVEGDVTICEAFARSPDPAEPRSLSVAFVRGRREDVVSDHVIVELSTTDGSWEHGGGGVPRDVDVDVPPATEWASLPSAGEPIGTAGETSRAVVVPEGARLAGPPHLSLDDTTGGIVAILEVTGDPRSVLQSTLDQLTDRGLEASSPETSAIGGATVTTARMEEAGGDHFRLTLVERPGRPAWLRIEGSHD